LTTVLGTRGEEKLDRWRLYWALEAKENWTCQRWSEIQTSAVAIQTSKVENYLLPNPKLFPTNTFKSVLVGNLFETNFYSKYATPDTNPPLTTELGTRGEEKLDGATTK
jgi:hypothetical protein